MLWISTLQFSIESCRTLTERGLSGKDLGGAGGWGQKGPAGCCQQRFRRGAQWWRRSIWSPVFISFRWWWPLRSRSTLLVQQHWLYSMVFLSFAPGLTGVVLVQGLWLRVGQVRQATILALLIHIFLRVSVVTRQCPRPAPTLVRQNCRFLHVQRSDRRLPLVAWILVQLITLLLGVFPQGPCVNLLFRKEEKKTSFKPQENTVARTCKVLHYYQYWEVHWAACYLSVHHVIIIPEHSWFGNEAHRIMQR